MRDSPERDLAIAEELGHMADARIKELEQTCADLRQVVRMCLQQFEFTYGKRSRGWDAQYLMARCGAVLGMVDNNQKSPTESSGALCWFCNKPPMIYWLPDSEPRVCHVACQCGASGPWAESAAQAVERWVG
jgi:hypothetical protein